MALDLRLQAPKVIAPEVDKNKLLLLGLNLLNKGLSLPCAIVQPQAKTNVKASTTVVKVDMKPSGTSPSSSPPMPAVLANTVPVTAVTVEGSRKRKRDPNTDINEPERREKRKMMNRVSAQNARDRKKAYVEDLEKKIALLEEKNKKLEEENSVLKKHTSSLAQEKEQLAEKLDHQADDLKALVKETLIQEPFWLGSAAETVPEAVVPCTSDSSLQSELMAYFLGAPNSTAAAGGTASPGSDCSEQPLSVAERVPLVGGQSVQMEPPNELKEMEDQNYSLCSSLFVHDMSTGSTIDLDFCDSLLNTDPDGAVTCKSEGLVDCDVEGFLQSACTDDLESLNLESFLSMCSPEPFTN